MRFIGDTSPGEAMRLEKRRDNANDGLALREAIATLRAGCAGNTAPCAVGCRHQPARNDCSPNCPDARTSLSSDPVNEPLEATIAPLVYQLAKLRVFQPYWSCGGHNRPDGSIWKAPRIWFYCADVVHARVLADCLLDPKVRKLLKCRWQVALTYCEPGNTGAAFAIEPAAETGTTLAELQSDARRLAEVLPQAVSSQLDVIEAAASRA
jgi:hypothetical protein